MRDIKRIKILFSFSAVFISLMTVMFLFMPYINGRLGENVTFTVIASVMFWFFALEGYGFLFAANLERRGFLKYVLKKDRKMNCRCGMLTFFSSGPAIAADVLFIISLIGYVVMSFIETENEYLSYVLLFSLLFSLNMHGLFNGRIYKITKYKPNEQEGEEKAL